MGDTKRWRGVNFASLIPVQDAKAVEGDDPGQIVLLMPRYQDWLLSRLLQPRLPEHKKYLKVPLEARGSFLWPLLDGRRTVGDLIGLFAAEFPEEGDQVGERIAAYLYNMECHGFIRFDNLETS